MEQTVVEKRIAEGLKTIEEAHKLLLKHRRCLVFRPTGFGKSFMLAHLSKRYRKSLYVYPTDIIKISMKKGYADVLNNTSFISYRALLEKYKRGELYEFLVEEEFDILMFDEVHLIGAENFRNTYDDIVSLVDDHKISIIGATATPDRMDGFDYQTELFKNIKVYDYTLHDCISNGIMLKPYYIHSQFDVDKDKKAFNKEANKLRKLYRGDKEEFDSFISQREIEIANILNASNIIEKHITRVYGKPDYLKFITFFSCIQSLHDTQQDVSTWFKEAFPEMNVNTLIVTSESDQRKNIELVDKLDRKENTIDLIMCVDMLNMGYHVDSLSGVVLVRGTSSDIVYKQQIGRCMHIKAKYPPIIFDFVNNYKKKPYFMSDTETKESRGVRDTENNIAELKIQDLNIEDNVASYIDLMRKLVGIGIKFRDKEIKWLYTDRKMPMYIIAERLDIKKSEVLTSLKRSKVKLEDESFLCKYCGIDKRKLYIVR